MGFAALAAEVAFFDVLLGVVPSTATGGHRDSDEDAGDDGADQYTAQGLRAEGETDDHGDRDRQQRRHDHFLDRGLGQHVDAGAVLRLGCAGHDAGDFLELTAYFNDHRTGGATDGFHAHGREEVGHHAADEQADDNHVVGQVEGQRGAAVGGQCVRVVGEQDERGETGGADGVALGDGFGGVADGVERVGDVADVVRQTGHFGDAAGVVGDRAVGVERDDDAGHRQHRGRRDGNAVEAGQIKCAPDCGTDDQHRCGGGLHRHAQAGDDVGAVAGGGGLRDVAHRAVFGRGVVLGDDHHGGGQREADQGGVIQVERGNQRAVDHHALTHHRGGDRVERDSGKAAGDDQAAIQRVHDLAAFARLDEVGADDGGDDGEAAEYQRVDDRFRRTGDQQAAQQHGGDDGDRVGLEQVGGHAGAVADVVTDVVGNHGGVARVVFRDAGFDLADQVGANVGAFGKDAAAESGEDGDQ